MFRSLSKLIAAAAVVPLFWAQVNPGLTQYCTKDAAGNFTQSFVQTGPNGTVVPAVNSGPQVSLCQVIAAYPV